MIESTALLPESAAPTPKALTKQAVAGAVMRQLPSLTTAAMWGQQEALHSQIKELAVTLEPHYPAVAKKLTARLSTKAVSTPRLPENLLTALEPRHGLDQVVLDEPVMKALRAVLHEHALAPKLAQYRLAPRHRILLHGAPGNGKTMVAEALAHELNLPLLQFAYGGLVDSHLGGTAKNLSTVLKFAATSPCVLFADEFDSLGTSRAAQGDVGEARRITNQLLIELERLPAHCIFVAATNMEKLLDSALLRRFDFVIELGAPSPSMARRCIEMQLCTELTPGFDLSEKFDQIAQSAFKNMFSIVELCKQIRRDLVLCDGLNVDSLIAAGRRPAVDTIQA